jgi:putative intracellular protease/amidase
MTMRLGILQCDSVRPELQPEFGDYPDMFQRLLTTEAVQPEFRVYNLTAGEFPESPDECDAWLFTGSKWSVYDPDEWIQRAHEFARELHASRRPTVGICFGQALHQALGNRAGIRRYGHFTLPMDEVLMTAAVDLGGRYAFAYQAPISRDKIGTFDSELVEHFWQSVAANVHGNFHLLMHYGSNAHHIAEAVFKTTARAIRMAAEPDPRSEAIPSTKGVL